MVSTGTAGDVYPFVTIGERLRHHGHEVTIATISTFESLVAGARLEFQPVWLEDESERAFANPAFWDPVRGPQLAWHLMREPVMRRTYAVIARDLRRGP